MSSATEKFKEAIKTSVPSKNTLGQLEVDYSKPIDKDAPSTIQSVPLEHEYGQAAMTLALDSLKQTESLGNKYIFWHPFLGIALIVILSLFLKKYPLVHLQKIQEESIFNYVLKNLSKNSENLVNGSLFITFAVILIFKVLANINSHYFSNVIQSIQGQDGEQIFGVNIKDYILNKKLIEDRIILKNNSNLIIYRNVPIALSVLETPVSDIKDADEDVVELKNTATITALSCRRVYLKSGILEDLINWSKKRCLDLNESIYSKKNVVKGQTICEESLIEKLQYKTYSYEYHLEKLMLDNGFKLVKIEKLDTNVNKLVVVLNLLGIRIKTWEIAVPVKEDK